MDLNKPAICSTKDFGVGDGFGDGLGDGEGEGVGDGEIVPVGVGEGDGDGLGAGMHSAVLILQPYSHSSTRVCTQEWIAVLHVSL
jgi:hypothetical protein